MQPDSIVRGGNRQPKYLSLYSIITADRSAVNNSKKENIRLILVEINVYNLVTNRSVDGSA
jgi:hypothetical protein